MTAARENLQDNSSLTKVWLFRLFGAGPSDFDSWSWRGKGELNKRLERNMLGGLVEAMETVESITDRQTMAKVREYF